MIRLSKKRHEEIKSSVIQVLKKYGNIKLSVPIKKIVKSLNYRLVPYSTFMKDTALNYEETIKHFGTDDACSEYEATIKTYVIFFNDLDKSKIENNRVRWSIAHELGHIVLNHHSNEHTRLFRNSLSQKEYDKFEEEADLFASYILVPYIVLAFQNIKSKSDISKICKISKTAAGYRYNDFIIWLKRKKIENYDKEIFKLYNISSVNQNNIFCLRCGVTTGYNETNYCYICGNKKRVYKKIGDNMIYDGIKLNKNKKVTICPICHNEELNNDDDFCKICGFKLYNFCTGFNPNDLNSCQYDEKLDGNARFCPHCGSITYFFKNNILKSWNEPTNNTNNKISVIDLSYIEMPLDEDLPF